MCLDYDGTLSEIVSDPGAAHPLPGVRETLFALAARPDRVRVAIVSGRTIEALHGMLGVVSGVALAGVHGLELMDRDGRYEIARDVSECKRDLGCVRTWLAENVSAGKGFVVEDKGASLSLHYRNADAVVADEVRAAFERFVLERTAKLGLKHGKKVVEAIPKFATKAHAVRTFSARAGAGFVPVYFGDDLTDEEAFTELAGRGITVLVGAERQTAARYRVDCPADVVLTLRAVVSALNETVAQTQNRH
jgi:trehalose 6-phosphate phosphatase